MDCSAEPLTVCVSGGLAGRSRLCRDAVEGPSQRAGWALPPADHIDVLAFSVPPGTVARGCAHAAARSPELWASRVAHGQALWAGALGSGSALRT
jgi:hypothetical protein